MWQVILVLALVNVCLGELFKLSNDAKTVLTNKTRSDKLAIIGGNFTTIEKHPYQVSLFLGEEYCSGVILNERWILSTGDCYYASGGFPVTVRVGSSSNYKDGKVYSVQNIMPHPKYAPGPYGYDFALFKLNQTLTFSETVKPIKLTNKVLKRGRKVVLSGWGDVPQGPLKELTLNGVDYKTCKNVYNEQEYAVSKSMICAFSSNGTGPSRDYGAPIVAENKLYGLYSWRIHGDSYPSVFSNVRLVRPWIKKTIKQKHHSIRHV